MILNNLSKFEQHPVIHNYRKRADPHVHTLFSDGRLEPEEVVEEAVRIGLSAVSITDHDKVFPALQALEYARVKGYTAPEVHYGPRRDYPLEFIPGIEVSSANGHILVWYAKEDIAEGRSAEETLYLAHQQGGLAGAAHPGQRFTQSLAARKILDIQTNPDPWVKLDASETLSSWTSRIPFLRPVNKSGMLYEKLPTAMGAPIGSSDAHFRSIGLGETVYPEGMRFREAVLARTTTAIKTDRAEIRNAWEMAWFVYETARWTAYEDPKRLIKHAMRQFRTQRSLV